MSQIVQVQSGKTQVRLPDLVMHDSLEKVLLTDKEFDGLSADAFTSYLTDLGPGMLAKVVALSGVVDAGQVVASFTPGFAGSIRSFCALVTETATTPAKAASLGIKIDNAKGTNEVQRLTPTNGPLTAGTFTLTFSGQTTGTLNYNDSAGTIQTALEALSNVQPGDVTCAGGPLNSAFVSVTFGGSWSGQDVPALVVNIVSDFTNGTEPAVTPTTTQAGSGGTNEIQRLTATGTPTGGSFTITWSGQTTAAIAWNATAADIELALEALSNIAPGDVTCTGGPINSAFVAVEFTGTLALANQPEMTVNDDLLTNATEASVAVTASTAGVQGDSSPTIVNGGVLALTSANCTPASAVVSATNIKGTAAGPADFAADSRIDIYTTAAPTDFAEGAVALLLFVEPANRLSVKPIA